jgi:hypothetical protein
MAPALPSGNRAGRRQISRCLSLEAPAIRDFSRLKIFETGFFLTISRITAPSWLEKSAFPWPAGEQRAEAVC